VRHEADERKTGVKLRPHRETLKTRMFCVIFEVQPRPTHWDAYLALASALRPELARIDDFIDNLRYRSYRHPGLLLSLSVWRNEKALIRWRTHALHHPAQEKGRDEVFADYHLRVGQIIADNQLPAGQALIEQRLDETETGEAKLVWLIEAKRPAGLDRQASPAELAAFLGMHAEPEGLAEWDVFEAILAPEDLLLCLSWRDAAAASAMPVPGGIRLRQVRIVRDYGMLDRREAPQYYPPVRPKE
jgi:heme-degrading monooxygenase HmoA